jgi:hypothetical protein
MKWANKYLFIVICVLFLFSIAFATDIIKSITAQQVSANVVRINWTTNEENGVSEFDVYRFIGSETTGELVARVTPNGSNAYSYSDDVESIFKSTGGVYLRYSVLVNGTSESKAVTVSYSYSQTSTTKRTWGSIKALFR